ncbi:hypothetical protein LUZ60_005706 [Juncus effusus]|nr:hypothetical protein LUZ60_005706 [Juncus effusus]
MFKPGRGGGGAAGRRPPARPGRAPMAHGRGRGGAASTSQQQGREELFSLESGGAPDFASIIRLVPGLVEEIERLEAQGGTARIKFGSNPMNHTENVIEVGPKQYHFNWSPELGVCDIYEQVQNGESNNGLLLERGSALRKMNVQRILDESAKNQVKMRSVQAELQSKSRKSIILDPANPSVKKQVQSMAAAGVEGSMRRWGGPKDKFKKSNQAPIAAPPPKRITIAKPVPAGSPPQHLIETINPKKTTENRNYEKRQTPVRSNNHYGNNNENSAELKAHLINILSENPKGSSLKVLEKAAGDSFPDSAKKIESIVKTIANYQAPGRYILKSGFASESSKAQPSDNKSSSDNEEEHDPILQALNEMDYNSTPQNHHNYTHTPQNQHNYNSTPQNQHHLNLNLEEDPLDIESASPFPGNRTNIDINEEIDIENGSPVHNKLKTMSRNDEIDIEIGSPVLNRMEMEIDIENGSPVLNDDNNNNNNNNNNVEEIDIEGGSPAINKLGIDIEGGSPVSSDESDSDSDSDSSDNSESSPSRAGSKSQSSSPSDSDNSSANEADADLEVNIMSDNDDKETLIINNNNNIIINNNNDDEIIPTDLNLSPALKSVSPQINLNEDLHLTPVENTNTDYDPIFGKKSVRENEPGFKRAGTSGNQKRVSTEKLLEGSKRPKTVQDSSPMSKYETSKKPLPKLSAKNKNNDNDSKNNKVRAVVNEGFCSDKPLRKHTSEKENPNSDVTAPPVKRVRESIESEKKDGNGNRSEKLGQKKVLRREKSELELGEFREPITKSPINDDDEFKRLFGSSSSSKYDDDSDDININNYNNNNNYDNNIENENDNVAVSSLDRLAGTSVTSTSGAQNNNNINNNNNVKNNNGRDKNVGVGPAKKNGELVKGINNNNLMQNGNGNNGIKKHYSSFNDSDEYLIYAKYDKDSADLKGPIRDFAKYKEYVNEYQEKHKVYVSLNKHLEEYRDKYLKVEDEMETAKQRNMREYNKVVDKLRDMYQHDKERHEFMKRVFLILHEELANLKQRLSDYYGDGTKDQ